MSIENKAEQYYPTYKAKERDILLLEFDEAQKFANGQTKLYGQITNILLAVTTLTITFFFDEQESKADKVWNYVQTNQFIFTTIFFLYGIILIRYFVELQKQIAINARKVITLRTLLGLDYGSIHLTLPNSRVEGANNPFVVKYFNGWHNFKSMPMWIVNISVNSFCYLLWSKTPIPLHVKDMTIYIHWYFICIPIFLIYLLYFRQGLHDRHETLYLRIVKFVCYLFGVETIKNFEYILYRAKLSIIDLDRLNVNYQNLLNIIVQIEDRNFYNNHGVSFKSLIRGIVSQIPYVRKKWQILPNGGSTLTMQLVRSLFVSTNQNSLKRKLGEILFAFWLNGQFDKKYILQLYITSVRYERRIHGLAAASKYFFDTIRNKVINNEEAFFLSERLSNITSTVNERRIRYLAEKLNITLNMVDLMKIYDDQIQRGRLRRI